VRRSQISVLCILFASCAFAKSGPRIPVPVIDAVEAIALARAVHTQGAGLIDTDVAKPTEYLLMRVEYVPPATWPESADKWVWEVEFAHPAYNDHRAEYVVDRKKAVVLKSVSE
jgi:hypothetical protein